MKQIIKKALGCFLLLTLITGVIYPVAITGISQLLFQKQANGSIIEIDGVKYGSALLAQEFTAPEYLWGRVMNIDTETFVDEEGNGLLYGVPSNLSPASEEFEEIIADRVAKIKAAHPEKGDTAIPVDLVTCSGSGLDPNISPAAANYQAERIAKARGITTAEVETVMENYTKGKFLGVFGEPTVQVLKVNLALDGLIK